MSLNAQVKDPDHNYQGMTDPKNCPAFVNDFDCRSPDIDPKYRVLQQKVQHHPPMMCCLDLSSCHQQLVLDAPAAVFCRDEGPKDLLSATSEGGTVPCYWVQMQPADMALLLCRNSERCFSHTTATCTQ